MKLTKNGLGVLLIYCILFIVFNVLVFTVFKPISAVFWVSYFFMTLAFVVQMMSMTSALKFNDVETTFFEIPLASFSLYYLGASLGVGAIFMFFQNASFVLALVLQLLIVAAFAIVAIIAIMARDTVKEVEDTVKQSVVNLKSTMVDVEMIMAVCSDPATKEALRKLSETVKYSDPMSHDNVADLELQIQYKVLETRGHVNEKRFAEAKQSCSEIELLYMQRNKMLLISK